MSLNECLQQKLISFLLSKVVDFQSGNLFSKYYFQEEMDHGIMMETTLSTKEVQGKKYGFRKNGPLNKLILNICIENNRHRKSNRLKKVVPFYFVPCRMNGNFKVII